VVTVKLNGDPAVADALSVLVKAGAWPTITVRVCVAAGLTPFVAVTVRVVVPVLVGVPDKMAVPLPLSVKVSPAGNVPVSVIAGVGWPVAVTATEPIWLRVKSAAGMLRTGAVAGLTVTARSNVAVLPDALVAWSTTG
jgi:hypothetical protein